MFEEDAEIFESTVARKTHLSLHRAGSHNAV